MASETSQQRKARIAAELAAEESKKGDLERLVQNVKDNPLLYAAGTVFVVVCLIAGGLFGLYKESKNLDVRTELAHALVETEDPAIAAADLESLAAEAGPYAPEVTYMMGEKALRAQAYEKAKDAFQRVIDNYPQSKYAPNAADALGYIYENRGDFEKALEMYQRIFEDPEWQKSFIGQRQPYNIARVQEALGHYKEAAKYYGMQSELFANRGDEQFMIAARADAALEKLKKEHPGLFPEEKPEEAPATTSPASGAESAGDISVEAPAPATEAPTAETSAPATEAPAADTPPAQ